MKLISWNINGIRSGRRQGLLDWWQAEKPAVLCLQEIKAKPQQLADELRNPPGYQAVWHAAEKPGYSGVVTYCQDTPQRVVCGLGNPDFDREGRVLLTEFETFTLINSYFPHSRRDLSRLTFKRAFNRDMLAFCQRELTRGKPVIVCGDFNTAHREDDLTNFRSNRKNAGFLPEERAWMDCLFASGFRDNFRDFNQGEGFYTWWSQRKGVRERNVGWRIDYHCTSADLAQHVKACYHLAEVRGSDHCPIVLEL